MVMASGAWAVSGRRGHEMGMGTGSCKARSARNRIWNAAAVINNMRRLIERARPNLGVGGLVLTWNHGPRL